MFLIFAEYRVRPSSRSEYLQFMTTEPACSGADVYEGSEQPGLFVEIWKGMTLEAYAEWKKERLTASGSPWRRLDPMIDGGPEKIHIWHFSPIPGS